MTVPRSLSLLASICILSGVLPSRSSDAAITVVKPDLKIVSIEPSPIGTKYARVRVTNAGWAPSGACVVRVNATIPSSGANYFHQIPAMPASSGLLSPAATVDVYIGASLLTPGQVVFGAVDAFGDVAESNELNNGYWYVAP